VLDVFCSPFCFLLSQFLLFPLDARASQHLSRGGPLRSCQS
jgi:hypothetical protein